MNHRCVGQVTGVVVLIVIVAVVTEKGSDALAFLFESSHVEWVTIVDDCVHAIGMDETVGFGREVGVLQTVDGPQAPHVDEILDFHLLRIGLRYEFVAYFAIEVATFVEQIFADGGMQLWIDVAHEYGL